MPIDAGKKRYVIDKENLPTQFPTHRHDPKFWEHLGRTVATFAFLEEILGKAIFAFTATRKYADNEIDLAYREWLPILEHALFDPLGRLIKSYGKAARNHHNLTTENLDCLLDDLRKAADVRNVLCHGSWGAPDKHGRSVPFYVDTNKKIFKSHIDITFLEQTQKHVAELACSVINTVTHMGFQFPSSSGPGFQI
jgi:hypothetical protein